MFGENYVHAKLQFEFFFGFFATVFWDHWQKVFVKVVKSAFHGGPELNLEKKSMLQAVYRFLISCRSIAKKDQIFGEKVNVVLSIPYSTVHSEFFGKITIFNKTHFQK